MKAGRLNAKQRLERDAVYTQVENVIKTCPHLIYPKIAVMLGVSLSTVEKVAKLRKCQRPRGPQKQAANV
jgi:hypothetical protein